MEIGRRVGKESDLAPVASETAWFRQMTFCKSRGCTFQQQREWCAVLSMEGVTYDIDRGVSQGSFSLADVDRDLCDSCLLLPRQGRNTFRLAVGFADRCCERHCSGVLTPAALKVRIFSFCAIRNRRLQTEYREKCQFGNGLPNDFDCRKSRSETDAQERVSRNYVARTRSPPDNRRPGTGKTTYGGMFATEFGFVHHDLEEQQTLNRFVANRAQFIGELLNEKKNVVVTWGFAPDEEPSVSLVLHPRSAGFDGFGSTATAPLP